MKLRPVSGLARSFLSRRVAEADAAIKTIENAVDVIRPGIIGKIVTRKTRQNEPGKRFKVTQCRRSYSGIGLSGVVVSPSGKIGRREFSIGELGDFEVFEVDE